MMRFGRDYARIAACASDSLAMKVFALPAIRYTMILGLVLGVSVISTTAAAARGLDREPEDPAARCA